MSTFMYGQGGATSLALAGFALPRHPVDARDLSCLPKQTTLGLSNTFCQRTGEIWRGRID